MENQDLPESSHQLDNFFDISFDAEARGILSQIALWAKICALCAFIGYGIVLIIAIFGHKDYSAPAEGFDLGAYVRMGGIGMALVSALIGGFINYFLYRFAKSIGQGIQSMDTGVLNDGFNNLRIYFKIFGVLMIIVLSLVALVLLFLAISVGIKR
jgi:hypothetical protein